MTMHRTGKPMTRNLEQALVDLAGSAGAAGRYRLADLEAGPLSALHHAVLLEIALLGIDEAAILGGLAGPPRMVEPGQMPLPLPPQHGPTWLPRPPDEAA